MIRFLILTLEFTTVDLLSASLHKVDDFSFEVINFPFPQSNIHSKVGYNAFYSQLVRFYRLCNNIKDFAVRVQMLYSKLEGRGYKGKILIRYFLKFCSRYPVNLKYSMADGYSLWAYVQSHRKSESCSIYDYDAINKIVRSCHVALDDIDPIPNHHTTKTKIDQSSKYDNSVNVNNTVLNEISIVPKPLANPTNHCYLNSILQVLNRIFIHFTEGTNINNNQEGCLVDILLNAVYSDNKQGLTQFKLKLAQYNSFFDGKHQRDAYECFIKIIQIIHKGTEQCLLGDDMDSYDEQFILSLTKRLFSFISKISFRCSECSFIAISYCENKTLFLYPRFNTSIENLLEKGDVSHVTKTCSNCHNNVLHEKVTVLDQPPEVLVIVINRFSNTNTSDKIIAKIDVNKELTTADQKYTLIGSVHHHGTTITSGHYTTNVFYSNSAFACNDNHIVQLRSFQPSDSIYLAFYTLTQVH